ncbi:MAG TPA: sodium:solute symporter family protein [Blastocatellia bacterium]|nr:sodium:solute symporter family protein [Blastocatellia bacterium]
MNIYLIVLAGYSLSMIALGAFAARRVRGSSDFFVAGRGLGAGYLAVTLIASNIGAGSTVGAAGLGYRDGLSAWWWVGSAGIGSLVLALWVGPKIWSVAREQRLLTVGDYLEHRFDRRVRMTAALFLWIGSLIILSGQLIAVAWILNVVAGASKTTGCLLGAVVATIYFSAGGLHSAVRVNLLQLFVKLTGFILALIFALKAAGALEGLTQSISSRLEPQAVESYLGFTGIGLSAVSLYLVTLVPSFIISPGLLQKVFGARDRKSVRRGVAVNAVVLLLFAIVPVSIGMIARGELSPLANRELAMPVVMTEILPLWLGTLTLAAIFSAEISTADAVLFMLTTSIGKDLYKGLLRPGASDEQLLRFTRWCAVACGAAGAVCALLLETVIGALTIFYSIITAVFFLPVVAGLYWSRVTARAALASIWVTVSVLFLLEAGRGAAPGVPSLVLALAAGALALIFVAAIEKPLKNRSAERGL